MSSVLENTFASFISEQKSLLERVKRLEDAAADRAFHDEMRAHYQDKYQDDIVLRPRKMASEPVARPASAGKSKRSSVSYVERKTDGRILCVWNRRYGGWGMPGGMVEEGETPGDAQARELREETGLMTLVREALYDAPHQTPLLGKRGSHVHVYRVTTNDDAPPREMEPSCPVTWLTRDELLRWSPFRAFYRAMFRKLGMAFSEPEEQPRPGMDWSALSPAECLSLLRNAPRVLGAWEKHRQHTEKRAYFVRSGPGQERVFLCGENTPAKFFAAIDMGEESSGDVIARESTLEGTMLIADTVLRHRGYLLA